MGNRSIKTLQPQYVKRFGCIGGACEDTCCAGWNISVDQKSYERYMRMPAEGLGEMMRSVIVKHPPEKLKPQDYAVIQLTKDMRCPFLNQSGLCRMQAELGENSLCNVCSIYPRLTNSIDAVLERSLSLSCPEAARLALLNEDYMEFDEGEEAESKKTLVKYDFSSQAPCWKGRPEQLFWDIRSFAIGLLQNREYRIGERLIILGLCLERIQQQIDQSARLSDILDTLQTYDKHVHSGIYKGSMTDIPLNVLVKLQLVSNLFASRFSMGNVSAWFGAAYKAYEDFFKNTEHINVEELTATYLKAYQEQYQPFVNCHEYIFENFLVNNVFQAAFPLTDKSIFHEYMKLVIEFSMVNTMLVGLCLNSANPTRELAVDAIRVFSRTVMHNPTFLTNSVDQMSARQQNNMQYMATLIAN